MAEETKDKEWVLRRAREMNIRFVRLQFVDILGVVKNVAIPVEQLPKALDGQIMFDGSSIEGFVRIEESDMLLKPDPATFTIFPWKPREGPTARLICDIYRADGTPFEGCPRCTLKRVQDRAAKLGFQMNAGVEAEFFLFERDAEGKATTRTHDQASYFDLGPIDRGEEARREMVLTLQEMGFEIEASHHEVAPGQHEIDFRYADAVRAADDIATFRFVVRTVAHRHGLHATFMPKPIFGVSGSGMHTHQSLFTLDGKNAFHDPNAPNQLSRTAMHYLGGLLAHARAYTAITNPLVNSYKRLVPGYEAPVYIAWSEQNRSPLVRIPARRGVGTRLELRSPDPSCNPYLALAATLAAGLDGIVNKIEPPPPVNRNIYRMTAEERAELGILLLPESLGEAIGELMADEVIREALGEHIVSRFVEAKQLEYDIYRTQVHQWELDQYLNVF